MSEIITSEILTQMNSLFRIKSKSKLPEYLKDTPNIETYESFCWTKCYPLDIPKCSECITTVVNLGSQKCWRTPEEIIRNNLITLMTNPK